MTYDPKRCRRSVLQKLNVRDLHWLLGALCVGGWFARRNVSGR